MSEPRPDEPVDDALVAQGLAGSQAALLELYTRHRPHIFHYVLRMTGDRDLADEVFCATFATFFENLQRYRPCGKLTGYLLRIARSRMMDELTARGRLRCPLPSGAGEADRAPAPDETAVSAELAERVRRAVAALPDHLREVVVLRIEEDVDYATIGDIVGAGEATVRSRMRYALQALRRSVEPVPDTETPRS